MDGNLEYGEEGKGHAHDAEEPTAYVEPFAKELLAERDLPVEDIDDVADSAGNECHHDGILLKFHVQQVNGEAEHHVGRGDEATHYGKGVLKPHDHGEEEGQWLEIGCLA